jgi:hypothetical protein
MKRVADENDDPRRGEGAPRQGKREPWQPSEQRDGYSDEDHHRGQVCQRGQRERDGLAVSADRCAVAQSHDTATQEKQSRGTHDGDEQAL